MTDFQFREIGIARTVYPHGSSQNTTITFFRNELTLEASLISAGTWKCFTYSFGATLIISFTLRKPMWFTTSYTWFINLCCLVNWFINLILGISFEGFLLSCPHFTLKTGLKHLNLHFLMTFGFVESVGHLVIDEAWQQLFLNVSWWSLLGGCWALPSFCDNRSEDWPKRRLKWVSRFF
jgi:hypothetical protein